MPRLSQITTMAALSGLLATSCNFTTSQLQEGPTTPVEKIVIPAAKPARDSAVVDAAAYDNLMDRLANGDSTGRWPVKAATALPGAILPYNRIIAYYGNLYSKGMGILGQLPEDEMLEKLQAETQKWNEADSVIKSIPALHYIAVTAQSAPGKGDQYRQRMPAEQIDKVLAIAKKIDAIVFLDIQVGHSTLQNEIPLLKSYLAMPNVHLGIDPEFSMKGGEKPGARVGTFDAEDINFATEYLADLVRKNNIPPKVLVVHRFTSKMVTNFANIKPLSEVQIVMHMDGFGFPAKKVDTYKRYVSKEPVQFTGFKIFYKNDIADKRWPQVMSPDDLLKLTPQPSYIQYQ